MLDARIIVPMEESNCISPMVVKQNKTCDISIFLDLQILNVACVHDFFPDPFIDNAFKIFGVWEACSFTNGILGYHQVHIAEEDQDKTTFLIEWVPLLIR
jgi:hypothetical protein